VAGAMSWAACKAAQEATPTITVEQLLEALHARAVRLQGTALAADAAEASWAAYHAHKALVYNLTRSPTTATTKSPPQRSEIVG
jgi:hypothetical protein